jgi:hypothetical protein
MADILHVGKLDQKREGLENEAMEHWGEGL